MRPSIRSYFERKKNSLNNESNDIPLSQNGIRKKRQTNYVNRLLRKCKEQYQRKTPEQQERIRQEARKVYYLRRLESIVPPSTYESDMTLEQWSQIVEERKLERDRIREQRRASRQSKIESKTIFSRIRLPRALMNPNRLKVARQKAREVQRKKRAGLTDEEKEAERRKGRERMRQQRAIMSEEEKQALREIGKQRMRLKRAQLNAEQKKQLREKERQRMRNKWASLNPEEQEAQRQRRREKSREKWASLTPEQREEKRKKDQHWRQQDRNGGPSKEPNKEPKALKEPKPPKKDPVPQKCNRPVDILSKLNISSAQLLVAEEAQPLPFANTENTSLPSSSQYNDTLVQERTPLDTDSDQELLEQLQGSMNMEYDDEQVTDNMSFVEMAASTEPSLHYNNDTLMIDQTGVPVQAAAEVRWQFKVSHCGSTPLSTAGQCY